MKKFLPLLLTALMILGMLTPMSAYAWNKTATFPNGPTRLAVGNAQDVLPLAENPNFASNWQDMMSPFTFDLTKQAAGKINGRLPMLGFNTWNYFGSGINEDIIKGIADSFIRLGLDKVGYLYVGIDDGCYNRSNLRGDNGELIPALRSGTNPYFESGFKALADYVHSLGLKLAMYNDVGTQTCNGLCSSSWGREDLDTMSYAQWGVDYVKYDFCNNPWNAAPNVAAPNIRSIRVTGPNSYSVVKNAVADGVITPGRVSNPSVGILGNTSASKNVSGDYVSGLTTNTGVNGTTGDLNFTVNVPAAGTYELSVEYVAATDATNRWLQAEVNGARVLDKKLPNTGTATNWTYCAPIQVSLVAGDNAIRLFNEKRREIGMEEYSAFFDGLQKAKAATGQDIIYSLCEWGYTQPWLWAWKVADSWRTTGDITFTWSSMAGIYSSNVLLDDYAGLNRGWNDPDMLEVGNTRQVTSAFLPANFKENESHFNLWAIMNSPLLLGNDLRTVEYGDQVWEVITNKDVIDLNQDPLGIQAKRVKIDLFSGANADPRVYTTNYNRIDYLVKPCANGDLAVLMVNLSDLTTAKGSFTINELINGESVYGVGIGAKMVNKAAFESAEYFKVSDLGAHSKNSWIISKDTPITADLLGHQSMTVRISMVTDYTVDIVLTPQVGDTVSADYTIIDPNATSLKAKLILAVYNENGTLRDVQMSDVNALGHAYRATLNTGVIAPLSSVKAFMWDENYIPMMTDKIYKKPAADKSELLKQIIAAEALDPATYTQVSFAVVSAALAEGKLVYAERNPFQFAVDAAAAALSSSISGLVVQPRIVLSQRITKARALNPAFYETASADSLAAGIVAAQAVYDNALASDTEMEAAIAALQAVFNGLRPTSSINFSARIRIRNAYRSNMCIEGYSGASGVGGNIDMWSTQTGYYDEWQLRADSNAIYFQMAKASSTSAFSNNVLFPANGVLVSGTALTLAASSATTDNQWWLLERQANGTYIISNKADPNLVIAINQDTANNGNGNPAGYPIIATRGTMLSQYWTFPPLLVP